MEEKTENGEFEADILKWLKKQPNNKTFKSSQIAKGVGLPANSKNRNRVRKAMGVLAEKGKVIIEKQKRQHRYRLAKPGEKAAIPEKNKVNKKPKIEQTKKAEFKPKQEKANSAKKAEASGVAPHILTTANKLRKNRKNQKSHSLKPGEKVPNPWNQ